MINSTNPCTAQAEATTAAPPPGGSGGTGIRTGMSERVSQWPMSRGDECWKLLGKRIRAVYVGQVAHCQPLQCANFLKLQRFSGPVANSFLTLFALRPRLYTWPCFCSVGGGKPPVLQPPPPSLKRRRKPSKKSHPYKEFACVCRSRLKPEVHCVFSRRRNPIDCQTRPSIYGLWKRTNLIMYNKSVVHRRKTIRVSSGVSTVGWDSAWELAGDQRSVAWSGIRAGSSCCTYEAKVSARGTIRRQVLASS